MNKKIVVSLIALAMFIGGVAFVVTRNNDSNEAEPLATVQELPEIQTQEIDAVVESEPEPEVEEVEEIEEVKVKAESNGVSENEEVEADEQESIVAVVEDDEEEAEEVNEADKSETTSTQTTETASIATNQSTATGIDDDILQKMEANGFSFTNGTDGMNIVEVENNGAGRDMTGSSFVGGNWE